MATSAKGKGRASSPSSPKTIERAAIVSAPLSPAESNRISTNSAQSTPGRGGTVAATTTAVRHGRGPLIRDSDDEDSIGSEDGHRRRRTSGHTSSRRRTGRSRAAGVLTLFCTTLASTTFILLILVAILHVWIGHLVSEQRKQGSIAELASRGLIYEEPTAVRLKEGTAGGESIMIEIDTRAGIDVKSALRWEAKQSQGWLSRLEDNLAAWGTRRIGSLTIVVGGMSLTSSSDDLPLVAMGTLRDLVLPITYCSSTECVPTLVDLTLQVPVTFPQPDRLGDFAKKAWLNKRYEVGVHGHDLRLTLGKSKGIFSKWMEKLGTVQFSKVNMDINGRIPKLPASSDPSSYVQLSHYDIYQKVTPSLPNSSVVAVEAIVNLRNPISHSLDFRRLAWEIPFNLPFSIYLPVPHVSGQNSKTPPEEVLMAKIVTSPFAFATGQKTTDMALSGHLVPAGNLSNLAIADDRESRRRKIQYSKAISRFAERYLAGKVNKVIVRYDTESVDLPWVNTTESDLPSFPPAFIGQILGDVGVEVLFPGAKEKLQLFQDLRIEDMKISLGSLLYSRLPQAILDEPEGDLLCSGKVVGQVLLPSQFEGIVSAIGIEGIWPDVYVYDGGLPRLSSTSDERDELDFIDTPEFQLKLDPKMLSVDTLLTSEYPPVPTPASAFARLHPPSFISSNTVHHPANATHNATTYLVAKFVNAPLFILPGRGDVFRRFVSKIIFGGPNGKARAGVRGISSARVSLNGWGETMIDGIPIDGEFDVGRGGAEGSQAD